MRPIALLFGAFLAMLAASGLAARPAEAVEWRPWSSDIFERAQKERRLVVLDLEAVWCHWCHVMERDTYDEKRVAQLIGEHFIAARVDQDANPDLASRYGDWGWPATILFAADGTELAKLRGYIPAERFAALLEAFIADPTPGPSAAKDIEGEPAKSPYLSQAQRVLILDDFKASFDTSTGGWSGEMKFIHADSMDYALANAGRDAPLASMAKVTLDSALALIDREWGGVFQYSEGANWSAPHYEKIMSFQAQYLRQYAQAYARWRDPAYLAAASDIYRYMATRLSAQDGVGFLTSQDADVSASVPGAALYNLPAAKRIPIGEPRIDRNVYTRENGWAISAIVAYHAVTGDDRVLARAVAAARWIVSNRALTGGGYRHGANDRDGPYLADTLAFGQAALDLYAATGDRDWLQTASGAGNFIAATFKAPAGYYGSARSEANGASFARPYRPFDENVTLGRFATLLARYTGDERHREIAEQVMRYLASDAMLAEPRQQIGTVLLDDELATEPAHITVIGAKSDGAAIALHRAALALPDPVRRIDWWDKTEGPLSNPDVTYPELETAAAYACANRICSLPVTEPAALKEVVDNMLATRTSGR